EEQGFLQRVAPQQVDLQVARGGRGFFVANGEVHAEGVWAPRPRCKHLAPMKFPDNRMHAACMTPCRAAACYAPPSRREISPAAARRGASMVSCITRGEVRFTWPLMLIAATVRPLRSNTGAAIDTRPSS